MKAKTMNIALVRGKHLNPYEAQTWYPLAQKNSLTGFGSFSTNSSQFNFPVIRLPSPADLTFGNRYAMALVNRMYTDAHYLYGLEYRLHGFDIAHAADTYYGFTWQCLQAKKKRYVKKVVATVWENIPYANEEIWGRKERKQEALAEIDLFFAVSDGARHALVAEGCNPDKIRITYPGIDTKKFHPKKVTPSRCHKILYVGRLVPEKGVWVLFEAFKKIVRKYPNLSLLFCGTGSEENALRRAATRLGLTHKITIQAAAYKTLPAIYRSANCLIIPSLETPTWKEQFGMVVVEGMASGLPIVASRTGAIPEIIDKAGILVASNDLAGAIASIIKNRALRKKLSFNARKRALSVFSIEQAAKRYLAGYTAIYTGR